MDAREDDVRTPWQAEDEYVDYRGSKDRGDDEDQDSRRIQRDIEYTRAAMDRTVGELRDRLAPRRLLDQAMDSLGIRGQGGNIRPGEAVKSVADIVRAHPLPVALIGAGLAWLVIDRASGGRDARERGGYGDEDWLSPGAEYTPGATRGAGGTGNAARRTRGAVTGAAHSVSEHAQHLAERAGDAGRAISRTAGRVGRSLSGAGETVRHQASHLGEQVGRGAQQVQRGFWETYDGYPLAVGAAALVLGALGGMAVPTTEAEDRLMGEASDEVARRAKEAGRQVVEGGKEVARNVSQAVSEAASRPGDLAGKVRDAATAAVDTAIDETRRQARNVQESLPGRQGQRGQQG